MTAPPPQSDAGGIASTRTGIIVEPAPDDQAIRGDKRADVPHHLSGGQPRERACSCRKFT